MKKKHCHVFDPISITCWPLNFRTDVIFGNFLTDFGELSFVFSLKVARKIIEYYKSPQNSLFWRFNQKWCKKHQSARLSGKNGSVVWVWNCGWITKLIYKKNNWPCCLQYCILFCAIQKIVWLIEPFWPYRRHFEYHIIYLFSFQVTQLGF